MLLVNEMVMFYYVVELKSFSKAAEYLGVSKSFLSKRINLLEKELKTKLLTRSTRKLSLTETGHALFQRCIEIVAQANASYDLISELQEQPSGTLKISAPPAFGINFLNQFISQFQQKYPAITLNIQLNNRLVDMIQEGYDILIRSAKLQDSNLIAQKITDLQYILCATPEYLKKHKPLRQPVDLEQHNCLTYSLEKTKNIITFPGDKPIKITVKQSIKTNSMDLIKQLVLQHHYVGLLSKFMVEQELKNNQLVHCLKQFPIKSSPLYVIYPEREFLPPKSRVFINSLKEALQNTVC